MLLKVLEKTKFLPSHQHKKVLLSKQAEWNNLMQAVNAPLSDDERIEIIEFIKIFSKSSNDDK